MGNYTIKSRIFLYNNFGFLLKFQPLLSLLRKLFAKDYGKISTLVLCITERCNLKCVYCSLSRARGCNMGIKKFKSIAQEAKRNGISEIVFIGGEPLLNPNLLKMLLYCNKKDIKPVIFTNGTLINPELADELSMIDMLTIVFKFDSELSYKEHVGAEVYSQVAKSIQLCTDRGISAFTNITVTKKNIKLLKRVIINSFKLGAEPRLERHIPLKDDAINKTLEISAEEWKRANVVYLQCYARYIGVPLKWFIRYIRRQSLIAGYSSLGCKGFSASVTIRANGNAVPCGLAPDNLSVGNINKEPLSTILEEYYKQREVWNSIPEECKGCKEAETCKGGCKAHAYIKLKRFGRDPLCKSININNA